MTSFGPSADTRTSAAIAGNDGAKSHMALSGARPASVFTSCISTSDADEDAEKKLPRSTSAPEPSGVVTDELSSQSFKPTASIAAEPA